MVRPTIKTTTYPMDQYHTPQTPRRDVVSFPRARHDYYLSTDHGPGPTTFELTPPQTGPKWKTKQLSQPLTKGLSDREEHISAEETIRLFEEKIEAARAEAQKMVTNEGGQDAALKPTLTINLGNARINRLPDSVIALIIADVERMSLSHNYLRYIPTRLKDCRQLRYLNLRNNELGDFPPAIYEMQFLEILDLSKNHILKISPEVRYMQSLRVFSITNNRLADLPAELADLPRLKVMKIVDNPLKRPFREVIKTKQTEVAFMELSDNDKDTALTVEILKHLRRSDHAVNGTSHLDNIELNEPQVDTSRPARRVSSGRFPVVPATTNTVQTSTTNSPEQIQTSKPIIPLRSHLRGLSGQNGYPKRPGIAPVVTNDNEGNRSQSESVVQNSQLPGRGKKPTTFIRRDRGLTDGVNERTVVKLNHARGHSSASTFKRPGSASSPANVYSSPGSPNDTRKGQFIHRLSALPEYKEQSTPCSPVVEGARGILYALFQANTQISNVLQAIRRSTTVMSQVDMVFHAAHKHLDVLNRSLENVDRLNRDDEAAWSRAEESVSRDCAACVSAYMHIAQCMQAEVRKIVAEADPRYVRSLMLLLYGSIVEIRNAIKQFGIEIKSHRRQLSSGPTHPIQTIPEEPSPSEEKAQFIDNDMNGMTVKQVSRVRSVSVLHQTPEPTSGPQPVKLLALQIPQTAPPPGTGLNSASSGTSSTSDRRYLLRSRSNSRHDGHVVNKGLNGTPRSTDSHHPPSVPLMTRRMTGDANDAEEELRFEEVFLALTKSYGAALQAIPLASEQFQACLEAAKNSHQPREAITLWTALVEKCKTCLDHTQALQMRLTSMRVGDPAGRSSAWAGRNDRQFWLLCRSFLQSFVGLVEEMRDGKNRRLLSSEVVAILRPVQRACRDAGHCIGASPWSSLTSGLGVMPIPTPLVGRGEVTNSNATPLSRSANSSNSNLQAFGTVPYTITPPVRPLGPQATLSPPAAPTPLTATFMHGPSSLSAQLPATPLSAALGPAVQATVPVTTMNNTGSEAFFRGDVFQRADHLMNQPKAVGGVNFLGKRI